MRLYNFYEDYDGKDTLRLYSTEVKETPRGFKAVGRTGLAFGCRTLFCPGDYETSEADARASRLKYLYRHIKDLRKEIADTERNIERLETGHYDREE